MNKIISHLFFGILMAMICSNLLIHSSVTDEACKSVPRWSCLEAEIHSMLQDWL